MGRAQEKEVEGKIYVADFIFTTCCSNCAKMTGNRILILKDGQINAEGTYAELEKSKDEWVRSFFI